MSAGSIPGAARVSDPIVYIFNALLSGVIFEFFMEVAGMDYMTIAIGLVPFGSCKLVGNHY